MSSKAAKRRRAKKHRNKGMSGALGGQAPKSPEMRTSGDKVGATARPTPERHARGTWASPQGGQKAMQPMVDLASDMIGALYQAGKINTSQEQAARLFQELWAAYLGELGTTGYGSCLADNQVGYDGGDGNPAVIAAYRGLENRIGRVKVALLKLETVKGPEDQPYDLTALQVALDVVAGA